MCLEQTKYILDATRKTVDQGLFLQKSIVKRFENRVLHACCMVNYIKLNGALKFSLFNSKEFLNQINASVKFLLLLIQYYKSYNN